ncbi:MAG: DUF748 domain-containing protein [Phycisphaerae bacterium]|nr:DUF748 domain-containing protein [Phycisphaerae bacterium]
MRHKDRKRKSFSDHPDKRQAAVGANNYSPVAAPATGGSETDQPAGGPPQQRIEQEAGHHHRWLRRLFWAGVILAAVIVVLRIALWLSLPWIIDKTMEQYGLNARYERLNLSLLTGDAELWHLVLVPTDANTPFADVEYCRAAVSLVTLFTRRLIVRRVEIDGMDINLTRAQDGTFPQLRTLLTVLRQRSKAAQPTDTAAAPTAASPGQIDLTPPLQMDALRLQHVQLQFRDETVEPVFETQLDLNVRLSDLRSDKRKTRFQILLSSPPVLDQLQIDGTGSAEGRDLLAEVHVALQGLHPDAVKDYLADLGLVPDARNLALSCSGSVRVQGIEVMDANDAGPVIDETLSSNEIAAAPSSATLQVQLESKNTTVTIDGAEHFVLEHAAVDANVADSGAIRAGRIQIRGGAFHAWRRPAGALSVGGFQFTRRPRPEPTSGPSDQRPATSDGFAWSLDSVEVRDVRLVLHDQSVSPQADLALDLNDVTVRSAASDQEGLTLTARLGAPGVVESLQTQGTVVLSSSQGSAALKISGTGIRPDALQPYLEGLGLESLYTGGTFSCDVNATFTNQPNEPIGASGAITNIHLQDTEELFGLKTIGVQGASIDPVTGATRIDQVEISGQRLAVARDREGCLATLGFRLVGRTSEPAPHQAESMEAVQEIRTPSTLGAHRTKTAPIEIGRLSWHDNELTFVDRMVTPAKTIAVPDLGFELTNLVLGGDPNAASPASVKAWLRSPGTIETVQLSGSVAPEPAGLSFDLDLRGEGLALVAMAPYLAALGTESVMTEGSVAARTKGRITWGIDGLHCSATIRDAAVRDGAAELAGLDQIDIAQLHLAATGFQVERIMLERPRLMLSRDESGVFACAGLRIVRGQKTETEASPEPVRPVRVGRLEMKGAQIQWSDHAVTPAVSQSVGIDLALSELALGVESPPTTISATVRAPGIVQKATVTGQLQTTPSKQGADLTLDAAGVNAGPLLSYLPPAVRPALEQGQLHARVTGELTAHPEGGRRIRASATDVDYRGDSEPEPFLRFDSAELAVDRFDPNAHLISIEQVSLQGLEATVERKASGLMSLLGFDFGASESAPTDASGTTDEQRGLTPSASEEPPAAQQTVPDQAPGLASAVARKARRLPLVVLDRLSLEASKLTVKDAARPAATPLVISNLKVANTETVKLLGDEPDTNPPVKIDVHGQIEPLTESLALKIEVSPFVAQPQILAEWDITQIQGPGLVSILPEVRSAVDANNLHTGRFSGTAQLTLHVERRDVAEFDFSRPFGVDAWVKAMAFRDAQTDTVLAGVEELRIVAPKVDLNSGSVHVKEIGLVNPQGAIRRETDGWHLLGMTWKTTAKGRSADANAVASANPQSPIHNPQSAFDLRVDQLLVTGVDFALVDNTVEPPMYVPLKGLDVEVRGFATAGADVKTPMRFNVIATAGEVPLPQTRRSSASASEEPADLPLADIEDSSEPSTMENRLLFQELSATGRLTLYPRPDGWVKAGLSGLELVNFRGVASESGVTLRKGVFDASVDMRFHKDQPLSTRARLVFTDLSLTEPPDGFLAQLLTLPASLDTVLFILRDAGGSIRLPLSFKIGEDGLSRGQITQAAVGAAATLIAGAVAGSPYRVAGTIGNILGGDKEETSGAETYVVEYAAGITMLSDHQAAELAQIAERLRNERDLAVTVRHHLGAADIEKAAGLVNLSEPQTKALLAKLRQERTELRRRRDELAGQTRAAYAAGSRGNVTTRTRQLQQAETQLGLIEQALDNLLETMRPGSEYAVRRRTQDACIAIGKARIETVAALLAIEPAADGPEASGRVTFVPPRFTEAGDPAGRITLTLSKSKAR